MLPQTNLIERLFGANWRTTLSGFVCLVSVAIHENPELLSSLPEKWQSTIKTVAGFVFFLSGASAALSAKDKKVTGGPVTVNCEGDIVSKP